MNIDLKPIAESKVRQLVGDVCGVLVRKEDGRIAAVDEHGRVTWLGDEQPSSEDHKSLVRRLDIALNGIERAAKQASLCDIVAQVEKASRAQGGQVAEPVAWASPLPDGTEQVTKELPERIDGVVPKDYQWYVRPLVYADAQPQPAQQGSVPRWKELEALADDYVEGYEFRGDEGDYQPNERERFLLEDCVAGLTDEIHQMLKRATPQPEGDGEEA